MKRKTPKPKKPKETPTAQHTRFIEIAKALGASDDPRDFDRAFKRIVPSKK